MSNNKDFTENIENYLQNRLSEPERVNFEIAIKKDPLLKNEVELQSDIINSIKKHRYEELKSRLNNIDVGSLPQGFNLVKIAATVSVGSMIAVGSYFYLNRAENIIDPINLETYQKIEFAGKDLPEFPKTKGITAVEPVKENSDTRIEKDQSEILNNKNFKENITSDIKSNIKKPDLVIPENISPSINEPVLSEDLEVVTGAFYNGQGNPNIEVNQFNDQEYNFHYQFEEGTLSLYGEFDKMPYELIELNTDQGTMLFLYYNNSFHSIRTHQPKVTPLEKITDQNLLEELKIIINSKSR